MDPYNPPPQGQPPYAPYGSPPFANNPYAAPAAAGLGMGAYDAYGAPLADRGARLGAALLDAFFAVVAAALLGVPTAFLASNGSPDAMLIPFAFAMLGVLALSIVQWYLLATSGQSLGKRIVGIKVVRVDGSPAGFGAAVAMRAWLPGVIGAIPYIGGFFSLVDVCMIFGEERRCLHDQMAGTKVVVANTQQPY
jgi:uncharacterized RDD family membrane protein YckC